MLISDNSSEIPTLNYALVDEVKRVWADKVKPEFSLGYLEDIVIHIALIQNEISPRLNNANLLLLAGDHQITEEGVSNSPQEITYQQVINFSSNRGAVGLMANDQNVKVKIVDCGVNYNFDQSLPIINRKVAYGASNFTKGSAMSTKEMLTSIENGRELIHTLQSENCNVVLFGEMGVGNTTSSSAITSVLLDIDPSICTSRGAGLFDNQLEHKIEIIRQAKVFHGEMRDPREILRTFGGYEIATMVGSILEAAKHRMVIIIDGFVTSCALLVASSIDNRVLNYVIASHVGKEKGHHLILEYLHLKPILSLEMSLGEGTGAILCWPIIKQAMRLYHDLESFSEAKVTNSVEGMKQKEDRYE